MRLSIRIERGLAIAVLTLSVSQGCRLKPSNTFTPAPASEKTKDNPLQPLDRVAGAQVDSPFPLRRITNEEYANAVKDLYDIDVAAAASQFGNAGNGSLFRNSATNAPAPFALVEKYWQIGKIIAAQIVKSETFQSAYVRSCDMSFAGQPDACQSAKLQTLMQRHLARAGNLGNSPATNSILSALTGISTWEGALTRTLEVLIQSPYFLFRFGENTGAYATARLLAFLIWQSVPDNTLLDLAASEEILQPNVIDAQFDRMFADPKAKRAFRAFIKEYLVLENIESAKRDSNIFKKFSEELAAAMKEEILGNIELLVFENKSVLDIFYQTEFVLQPILAAFYLGTGPDLEKNQSKKYQLGGVTKRFGLMTMAGLLMGLSPGRESNPIRRGVFFAKRFLCTEVPPPPPGAGVFAPELHGDTALTPKKKLERHRSSDQCAGCHRYMDGIGLALEEFDAIGELRVSYQKPERPIDPTSEFAIGNATHAVSGPEELSKLVRRSAELKTCFVKRVFEYATGYPPRSSDQESLDKLVIVFAQSGESYRELLRALVKHMLMR